ncbi:hypothetical protein K8W59_02885 [Nocardioides rotundus]|uniref:hypothetical protein n=1 Tax=Nocardioides rotundus TaxID=1774216 RepID=UPI001CBC831B|nr:hypothetical protein [Nocardioides rotundus]UAL30488.1 hypothetical protein K8W59_02885 [Nocardioides rotundus]
MSVLLAETPAETPERSRRDGLFGDPVRALTLLMVAMLLLQRLSVPVGGFDLPVAMPVSLLVVGGLLLRRAVTVDAQRFLWFCLAVAAMGTAVTAANWSSTSSVPSLAMVIATFGPWVLRVAGDGERALQGAAVLVGRFITLMSLVAVVAGLQMAAQLAGVWEYKDLIQQWVPSAYLLGDYNTSIPLEYGSSIHKAQAFVFLEPSMLSQFCGLALVAALVTRRPVWQVLLLGVGLVSAFSGTGLILLATGVVALALSLALSPRYLVLGVVGIVGVLASPAGDVFRQRTAELYDPTSSLALRFVLPYQEVAGGMAEAPIRWLRGAGPGGADALLESMSDSAGLAVVYPIPAKTLFEYGLIAGALFLWFVLLALLRGAPSRVLACGLLVQLWLLGGYLIAPHVVITAWCLSVAWRRDE